MDKLWKGLTYTLAGLYCASLEQMKSTVTSQPQFSFAPESVGINNTNPLYLRYSTLAREAVCTENLTPWIKMLPCRQKVSPIRFHLSSYRSYSSYNSDSMDLLYNQTYAARISFPFELSQVIRCTLSFHGNSHPHSNEGRRAPPLEMDGYLFILYGIDSSTLLVLLFLLFLILLGWIACYRISSIIEYCI